MAVALAACGSDGGAADDGAVITVPPTLATTTTTTATTTTTTEPGLPTDHLDSCVENAKLQAFLGNEFWAEMWSEADMNEAGMADVCRFLYEDDPAGLAAIHEAWLNTRPTNASVDATGTASTLSTSTTTTSVLPAESLDAAGSVASDLSLVAGCTAWVEFFAARGVQRAIDLWTEAGGSTSAVRALCTAIAEQDPTEATLMSNEMEGTGP